MNNTPGMSVFTVTVGPDGAPVSLTAVEMHIAAEIGIARHISALISNLKDGHGRKAGDGWGDHIEGACGEAAVAKFLNCFWSHSVNQFREGQDVWRYQVRTRREQRYDCIIRDCDRDDDVFILCTGMAPHYFIRGWIKGRDAKRDEYLKDYGGRPTAWFVPVEFLNKTFDVLR